VRGSFISGDRSRYLYVVTLWLKQQPVHQGGDTAYRQARPGLLAWPAAWWRRSPWPAYGAGCLAIIAVLLTRSIYAPWAGLAGDSRVAQGDYTGQLALDGPPEVRELAVSFNRMTQAVGQAQLRLRHFVAERIA
jgi:HAMP domain-containing protein